MKSNPELVKLILWCLLAFFAAWVGAAIWGPP